MKKIHIILISILCGLSSCTSVLDKEPLDIISDDVLWNDPVLIDNYLLQCYAEMCFFNEMPYYWPIAQSRTQQNPNLLPNNPGWR